MTKPWNYPNHNNLVVQILTNLFTLTKYAGMCPQWTGPANTQIKWPLTVVTNKHKITSKVCIYAHIFYTTTPACCSYYSSKPGYIPQLSFKK